MGVLLAGESLIVRQTNITSGELKISNAYDLYLVKLASGNYRLIMFMKVQFFFENSGAQKWTASGKLSFVNRWRNAVKNKWGSRTIKTLSNGKKVKFELRFKTQIGGWMFDHWEITVRKIQPGGFRQSSVNPRWRNVSLDSEDLTLVRKGHGNRQRGVVHEFGHMLGINDEYISSSAHKTDYRSIMNRGESVMRRHEALFTKWLNKKLKEKGIN